MIKVTEQGIERGKPLALTEEDLETIMGIIAEESAFPQLTKTHGDDGKWVNLDTRPMKQMRIIYG